MKRPFIFDMETGDPDDFLTLALLCGHPQVDLKAVTITPGTPYQVGVVRYCLNRFDLNIPVGAYDLNHGNGEKKCVSDWHYNNFGDIPPSLEALPGWEVLDKILGPETTLVTGGPLKNLGNLLTKMQIRLYDHLPNLGKLVVQGGFAGEGVVPSNKQLSKFKGKVTCPTYNLNGDPKAAHLVLASRYFESKHFVSKNVCHGVVYDWAMHHKLEAKFDKPPLHIKLIMNSMQDYLRKNSEGKKFHDPLAACCAIDPSIGTWAEVELYRERGDWGSRLCPGSGIWIITDYDPEKFFQILTE
jgi:pyrimidine-specific ribonucleoside hydrolase